MASKRSNGDGSLYRRSDGRWEGKYTAGHDPETGKSIRRSIYGKTEKEVREKLRKISVDLQEGNYLEPSKMTLGEWLDIWIQEYNTHTSAATIRTYTAHIKNHIRPGLGLLPLQKLSVHEIQIFCNNLQRSNGSKPLAPKTINVIHGVLHKALDQALELGYIKTNPANKTKLPKIVKPKINPLTDEQIKKFMGAIESHRFRRPLLVVLFTGIREAELVGLTWGCVDFETGNLEIRYQLQQIDEKYQLVSVKRDKPRTITPAPMVMELLKEQQLEQKKLRLKAGSSWCNDMNLVFTDDIGRYITGNTIYKAYKRIVAALGLPESRLHDLRHTFAVNSLRSGDDIKTVQGNLGHFSAAFTLDTYGHVTDDMRLASAQRMQDFIDSLAQNN